MHLSKNENPTLDNFHVSRRKRDALKFWFFASRPKTLTAAVVPVSVGAAVAHNVMGTTQLWITVCALFSALFIQIGTNYLNDALDFKKGADTHTRIGPKRVTQAGIFSLRSVMAMGFLSFLIALLLGIPLVIEGGKVIVFIGLISLLCGYAYTGGPYPLAYKGLGELFVLLFFGIVAVGGVTFLHTKNISMNALIAGLQVGIHACVLIAINNLRDSPEDAKVNKLTLAARFGEKFARKEVALFILLPFLLSALWVYSGQIFSGILPLVALPLGLNLEAKVRTQKINESFNSLLAQGAVLHIVFGTLLILGLLIDATRQFS